jgi:hypothetical protein
VTEADAMVGLAFVTSGFEDAVELSLARLQPDSARPTSRKSHQLHEPVAAPLPLPRKQSQQTPR